MSPEQWFMGAWVKIGFFSGEKEEVIYHDELHGSRPLNPSIANTFFRIGFAESWGQGISKMCINSQAYGMPDPKYQIDTSSVLTQLQAAPASAIPAPLPTDSPQAKEDPLITLIRQSPTITRAQLAEHLGVSVSTIARRVQALKEQGLIIRIGSDRDGEWQLK